MCACVRCCGPCPWIRDGGGAGNGLDGIISGWMKGGLDGWMDRWKGGAGYPRDSSEEDRMRETRRRRKKGGHCLFSGFLSKASVTAAEACLLLLPFS